MKYSLVDIREREARDIRDRRRVAGVDGGGAGSLEQTDEAPVGQLAAGEDASSSNRVTEDNQSRAEQTSRDIQTPNDLVGLALSGGGVRSACISLGLIQAFHQRGLLKFCDYLSTVSGGGYIGAYLTSHVVRRQQPINNENFPLQRLSDNRQPPRMLEFIYGGEYLKKPWQFANKYFIGLFINNVAFLSGLIALCALAALLWRCLDLIPVRDALRLVELSDDSYAPFWPFLVFLVCWIISWVLSFYRRGTEAPGFAAGIWLYFTAASLLIGVALLLGNGDISLGVLQIWLGEETMEPTGGVAQTIVLLVLAAFLPFVRPARLLQSGISPTTWWEGWVFSIACVALLVGLPMVVVGLLGRENISGFADHRSADFVGEDIRQPGVFCAVMSRRAKDIYLKNEDKINQLEKGENKPENKKEIDRLKEKRRGLEQFLQSILHEEKSLSDLGIAVSDKDKKKERLCLQWEKFRAAEDSLRGKNSWERWSRPMRLRRLYWILGWQPQVSEFWQAKGKLDCVKKEAATLLNDYVLNDAELFPLSRWQPLLTPDGEGIAAAEKNARQQQNTKMKADLLERALNTRAEEPTKENANRYKVVGMNIDAGKDQNRGGDFNLLPGWSDWEIKRFNRFLLEAEYPQVFYSPNIVQRRIVIGHDQWGRFKWLLWALAVFFGVGLWVDVNATSLHRFYRNQVAHAFIERQRGSKRDLPVSEMRNTDYGAPYHLIHASVSLLRRRISLPQISSEDEAESDRRWIDSFLFSRRFCGSQITGYERTAKYESYIKDNISLADATALSGAAVSPGMINNWLLALLMLVCNLRLGQWLPNPERGRPRFRARVISILTSYFRRAENRPYCFVSDGGFAENLGLVALLKRRCRLILLLDATHDPDHQFKSLGRAIRQARVHGGVEIVDITSGITKADTSIDLENHQQELQTDDLEIDSETGECQRHFLLARVLYPERMIDGVREPADIGWLVYMKPCFTGDESVDLRHYRTESKEFPHHSTADVLYDAVQVESYRQLGHHIGLDVCRQLFPEEYWEDRNDKLSLNKLEEYAASRVTSLKESTRNASPRSAREKMTETLGRLSEAAERIEQALTEDRATRKEKVDIAFTAMAGILETLEGLKHSLTTRLSAESEHANKTLDTQRRISKAADRLCESTEAAHKALKSIGDRLLPSKLGGKPVESLQKIEARLDELRQILEELLAVLLNNGAEEGPSDATRGSGPTEKKPKRGAPKRPSHPK